MNLIHNLKQKLEVKTSEKLFDIDKAPEYQCTDINNIQSNFKDGFNEITVSCQKLKSINDADDLANDIESSLNFYFSDKVSELESIRTEIENIRIWGENWKNLTKAIINDLKEEQAFKYLSNDCQIKYDELFPLHAE